MIPEFNTVRGINPCEHFHYRGKYVIRTERRGGTLLYDVLTRSGLSVAAGLDMLNVSEEVAIEGIIDRLYGKGRPAHA